MVLHPRGTLAVPNSEHSIPERPNRFWGWGAFLDYRRGPLDFYQEMAQLGALSRWRFGSLRLYFINHPDFIQYVLQQNHRNFRRSDFDREVLGLLVGKSLLTTDGDYWLRQRRLMQPAFHRKRIAALGRTMTDATREMLEQWEPYRLNAQPFDVAHEMMRLTLRLAGLSLFSIELSEDAEGIGQAVTVGNKFLDYRMRTFPPLPLWVPTPRHRAFKEALQTLDAVVYQMIRERRQEATPCDDLLAMLLEARDEESGEGMSDQQLRDEIVTMLVAGHETTANALAWTFMLLSQNPAAEQKLHAELDEVLGGRIPTINDLADLSYTRMVIEEAMRLYPPAWALSRQSVEADEIGGHAIEAGAVVVMTPYTMHRHPEYWEAPERFEPERFSPDRSAERPKFAYFPFGGGPHLCIGSTFALTEAQLVLATVAQRYRLRLVPGYPVEPEALVTLRPRYGIRMTVHKRGCN